MSLKLIPVRLKIIRTTLGLTQKELANNIGFKSYRSWQEIESGNRKPTFEVLCYLSSVGFSIDWIISGKGSFRKDSNLHTLRH
jgi:transcriptional regulator with XRE-family HTH domain